MQATTKCCLPALILLLQLIPAYGFSGQVVAVTDGDTVKVMHSGQAEKVRLARIDCPEHNQPFGQRAKQFTAAACFGRVVTVEDQGKDKYGRSISEIILPDGKDLNRELVREGLAWWYRKYAPNDSDLSQLENTARLQHRGLWADANPTAPWEFRRIEKQRKQSVLQPAS